MVSLAILFATVSQTFSLPPGLLSSICWVESSHRPAAKHYDDGGDTSLGTCQIKLPTARLMGFRGTPQRLMDPGVNIYYSGKYLAWQLKRYRDPSKAILAYNAGSYRIRPDGRPINQHYLDKVNKVWHQK